MRWCIPHSIIYLHMCTIGVGCNKRLQAMMGDMVRERGASLCAMDYRLVYCRYDIHMQLTLIIGMCTLNALL